MQASSAVEFIQYLPEVITPWRLTVLTFGTIGGLLLGAAPGISPTLAVALLIPFTFQMEPAAALILLGAAYSGTVAVSYTHLTLPTKRIV